MNDFFKGNWCRFPKIGTVGGPGGKSRGRRLSIEYRMMKDRKQITAAKANQPTYLYIIEISITTIESCDRLCCLIFNPLLLNYYRVLQVDSIVTCVNPTDCG
jgi:hypothetical protein